MKLEVLVYSPLKEEQVSDGWQKQTVEHVCKHREKAMKTIRSIAKGMCKQSLQSQDVDDIYSEIILYLYKSDDYDLAKAVERSSSGTMVSLEGYINTCIKYCVLRYLTNQRMVDKEKVADITSKEGKEVSIFDTLPDKSSEEDYDSVIYDLTQQCKAYECKRYKYGPDIYLVWYVRLLTLESGDDETYRDALSILGIDKRELARLEKSMQEDDMMQEFAKAIANTGIDESLRILEEYIYSYEHIRKLVNK